MENETTPTTTGAEARDLSLTGNTEYPGQTMGIVALVLAFFLQVPALILGIIAWVWSNKAGVSNVPAKVAVAVSAVLMVLGVLALIGWIIVVASTLGGLDGFGQMGGPRFGI
jgi:hypothetical protein